MSEVRDRGALVLSLVAVSWVALAAAGAAAGLFERAVGSPPIRVALTAGVPVLVVGILLLLSHRFREWARSLDLSLLVAMQGWRVIGFVFLAYYAVGLLPAGFALPAGIGDLVVGFAAPYVARRLDRGRGWFLAWTVFGLLDFVVAVTLGAVHDVGAAGVLPDGTVLTAHMAHLPLVLIPTAAVPFLSIVHMLSLVRAYGTARQ
ncbi:hypothetical protein [Saccharothrix variisporea]|uniref:Uncharacterized protein n=1 Tax=Saccharothrix variisporea TaxID=543527 RepID=A0A495X1L3_9PSEU|nr:hypothetical protein [Saccharothrix variisporea]RKT67155.1 hypothetical protein DFJ66_0323 [Saccharothrix variisporea]